ncbi:efflux RND transporter permease subunit [Nocardioides sp. NPDC059952]|uniref:efflux RND transporter permease subunit n=1 Tax=Nocardioides sp. NPDC059952 TaxID=3347014 RepID=UPI00364892D8
MANRAVVALLTLLIAAAGVLSLTSLKQELFPDFEQPQTTVMTVVPGTGTEVVDEQVTVPLVKALEQVDEVDEVTSTSSSGVSVISLSTDFGVDQDQVVADAQEAIDSVASQLPEGAEPEISSGSMDDLAAMTLTVSSDASEQNLGERLNDIAVPELRTVEGVRDVSVSGVTGRRITITPDTDKLSTHGLTTDSISQALQSNGSTTAAGSIEEDGSTVSVQVGDELTSVDDVKGLPLTASQGTSSGSAQGGQATGGGEQQVPQGAEAQGSAQPNAPPVTIGEVAKVEITSDPVTSLTRVNGEPAVSVSITATDDADLVSLSADVEDKIDDLEKDLDDNAEITVVSDQAPFISDSIEHLAIEGLLGLAMAVIVILLFLRSGRATVVSALSIPLSILVAFIGLYLWGYSLNMFTLGALTIAIGRVVDDSIVVIENIKRHLGYGEEKVTAILDGTKEVASAVTASTVATVLVFVPIALVGGFVGELFRPFALTVTIAMVSSLLVALTIVPVLSYWFLKKPEHPAGAELPASDLDEGEEAEPNILQRYYLPLLRWTTRKPIAVIMAAVILLGGSLSLIPQLKVEFLGNTGGDSVSVTQTYDSGLSVDEVTSRVTDTEKVFRDVEDVEDVVVTASLAGSGETMMQGPGQGASGDTTATYTITLADGADVDTVTDRVEDAAAELPDPNSIEVGQAGGGSVGGSTVDVQVTGTSRESVEKATDQVYAALKDVPDTTEVSSSLAAEQPTLRVQVDREKAAESGLTEQAVTGIVASAMTPQAVTEMTVDDQDLSVYVAGTSVETTEQVSNLTLGVGDLRLKDVAKISEVKGPSSLARTGTDLVATVSLTPAEDELGSVQTEVNERLDGLDLPDGVDTTVGGVSEQQTEAFSQLGLAMLVAVGLIFILLVGILRSAVQPLILMMSIPFAAIGSLGLLFVTGTPLGVSAMIGMLMLIGIVVTNAIVLMDLINQYRRRGQSVADAIHHGAGRRVRPVVMTALATIFALVPMATGITGGSGFISQSLAIVVIGGLVSSTFLTLLLVPAVYQLIEGRHERRERRRQRRRQPKGAQRRTMTVAELRTAIADMPGESEVEIDIVRGEEAALSGARNDQA